MGKQLKQAKEKPKQRSVKIEEAPEVKKETREVEIKAEPVEVETKKTKKTQEKRKGKGNRLIIRNLVFDMNEKHIRKLMAPYGEIIDIEIPLNPDN
jgi:RNA recognition motif-containing protein